MQLFATLGLVALGLGLSMLVREFDLSVAGMVGLAGCIAVHDRAFQIPGSACSLASAPAS